MRDHDSMSHALIELHWLPVNKRIEYTGCCIRIRHCMTWHQGIIVNWLCRMCHLLTVPPGKPGKYGSRSFAIALANLWNSLREERDAWLKNSPTLESFKRTLNMFLFWERFLS